MKFASTLHLTEKYSRAWALTIALCFGVMTLFSPVLHDHDWDPFHADSDCAPCNWTQSNVSLEVEAPSVTADSSILFWSLPNHESAPSRFTLTRNSRSPPAFR